VSRSAVPAGKTEALPPGGAFAEKPWKFGLKNRKYC
jgi:hypothetical protein